FKASWLGRALSVLANPEARLRIALVVPGQAPIIHSLFVRDGRAVYSESDLEGFYLSEPLATSDLVEFLLATVSSRALPRELEALCLLPEVYELSSVLWKKRGKAASDPISLREVENLLESGPHRRNAALELLGVLLEVGLIEPVGSRYFITESFRPWLDLVWSGQVVEIERTPLAQPAELEAEPTGQRMIFAGPAGRRILCEDIVASAGEPLVLLTRPTRCDLKVRLSRLMRPLAAGATAQGAQVARMADASEEPLNRLIDIN
ncbi:MAG TPA: hypothetical protein PK413_14170, partial [Thermoanaerobaculia bacterium]|nr:hypothetical protein [Thermoanaerobaculia bacterium]